MEMNEQAWSKENHKEELIPLRQIIRKPEAYVVNPKPGVQDLILIDHEKKEEERQQMKMMAQTMNTGKDKGGGAIPGIPGTGTRERAGRQRRMRRQQKKTKPTGFKAG